MIVCWLTDLLLINKQATHFFAIEVNPKRLFVISMSCIDFEAYIGESIIDGALVQS